MKLCYAVLVDRGFIKRKLGTAAQPMDAAALHNFISRLSAHAALADHRLHRMYFYDSAPLTEKVSKPLNGGAYNFGGQPIVARSQKLHSELAKLPFVALRTGELVFRGWQLKKSTLQRAQGANITISSAELDPFVQQKGVDMRIGLDIAALTLKRIVQVIVLVTGDSDFIPAMKFARREGAQLFLAPLGHRIRDGMHDHADLVLDVV